MSYRAVIAREAEKSLDRLDRPTEQRIRKSRVGGWRILFAANRDTKTLFVLAVGTWGQVYIHS